MKENQECGGLKSFNTKDCDVETEVILLRYRAGKSKIILNSGRKSEAKLNPKEFYTVLRVRYNGVMCFFPAINPIPKALKDFFAGKAISEDNGAAWLTPEDRLFVKQTALDVCGGTIDNWSYALEKKEEIFEKLASRLAPIQIKGLRTLSEDMYLPYPLANGVQKVPGYLPYLGVGLDMLYPISRFERTGEIMKIAVATLQYMIMKDPEYNLDEFDLHKCKDKILEASELLDATNPDISEFMASGGKLIILHGIEDEMITPKSTVEYYESLENKFGDEMDDFVKLYLLPGYGHNKGSFIPRYDFIKTLENWVENDIVPDRLTIEDALQGNNGRTITIYPYPGHQ